MNSPTSLSPGAQLFVWPLQLAQLSARALQADIDGIKRRAAERRLDRIAVDLETLRRADEAAYERLKARLRELVRD